MDEHIKKAFWAILQEELIPAMGCTEPIALALAAARGREYLPAVPAHIVARCSDNIIKNVRCVQIPHSGGLCGIEAAVLLGAVGGDASRMMQVLEAVDEDDLADTERLLASGCCEVECLVSEVPLHFVLELETADHHTALVEVKYDHMNIVRIEQDGVTVFSADDATPAADKPQAADRSLLTMERIKEFADTVSLDDIEPLLSRQIECNMAIAERGLTGAHGLDIGNILLRSYPDSTVTRMKAWAAAGSEARMDGCDMPVIINSGSGNQGIASSVPVIVYAREHGLSHERLLRALAFSALLTVYQKEFIGKLSAFCGAVSASCAAGAAITYLVGGTMRQIKATVGNTLANVPGIICDGAKISCAAKIASSIDAAMLAHFLAMNGREYRAYTGILKEEIGETIRCVGHIGKVGMKETDKEIVKLMLDT